MMTERLIASDKSDSSLSSEGEALEELRKRDRSKSRSTAGSSSRAEKNKRLIRKLGTTLLDSNGESEDEEINKLQKIIQDQAKELNDERQTSKKLKVLVKLLKRETKQLQKEGTDRQKTDGQQGSDSDNPPWERRKMDSRIAEMEQVLQEKNDHIERLLRDCRSLEQENQECTSQIQHLSQQFDDCTHQLHLATHNYAALEEKYKDRVTYLEEENDKIRIQLDDCQWHKEKNEENLDRISEAVDFTINKCKEIIISKERAIESLEAQLLNHRSVTPYGGGSNKEEEIDRLRTELAAASAEMEESARLLERFQGLDLAEDKKISSSVKRKLKQLETIKANLSENERLLTERDEQVTELIGAIKRYESGTYGLNEVTKELREAREQLKVRDDHIERLIEQLNALEERVDDLDLENNHLREQCQMETKSLDLSMKRMTVNQKLSQCQKELQHFKEDNMRLGLENRSFKRAVLRGQELSNPPPPESIQGTSSVPTADDQLVMEYQKACSEVIVLRKGLVEILDSVRQHDGTSDVKIESPILERLVTVLNSERLFGHYDAYADIMNENSSVHGENKVLRERIRELKSVTSSTHSSPLVSNRNRRMEERQQSAARTNSVDQGVQVTRPTVDSASDPVFSVPDEPAIKTQEPPVQTIIQISDGSANWNRQVQLYEEQLSTVRQELTNVKLELDLLSTKHATVASDYTRHQKDLMDQINQKNKRIEEVESELESKEKIIFDLSLSIDNPGPTAESPRQIEFIPTTISSDATDETKMRMEKELVTLKVRLEHKEQTLKRSQQFLDEVRLEQLRMIEEHSQEILNLQDTILDQQRAMHRVEQTQREIAASAASSRAVVRHLETEVDSGHQVHVQLSELSSQLETVRKQAAQWKHAAEVLSKEKHSFRESLETDHRLIVEQIKSQLEDSQTEAKELREKVSDLQRQLTEERFDKQRSTLLQVLVAKLKNELDKKEQQMDFVKKLAEEMHSRMEKQDQQPLVTSTPVPVPNNIPLPTPAPIIGENDQMNELKQNLAEAELINSQLEKTTDSLRKQLEQTKNRENSAKEQLKEQVSLVTKLQNEKTELSRQVFTLRTRVTKMTGEKAAAQTTTDDVCRLLKRIKELEAQLAMFHTAEKPAEDPANVLAKNLAMEQWKERKKLQAIIDSLKNKLKELQDRLHEGERQGDSLKKVINRLVNEKRVLEDKLKFKANDNERIHRLVEENTHWRIRFEGLEQRMREMEEQAEEETNTDRHRLQISVLQERIKKQEEQIVQLQLDKSGSTAAHNNSTTSEDVVAKVNTFNTVESKLRENIQRLVNLVQMPTKPHVEKRLTIQEGPSMWPLTVIGDIRKTVKTLHQLIYKLSYMQDL